LDRDEVNFEILRRKLLEPVAEVLRVCDLYFLQRRRVKEIAAIIGKPESTVQGILFRARRKLRGS
jgi:DNA-directed RNA polymerase specialized sigma24 family protein